MLAIRIIEAVLILCLIWIVCRYLRRSTNTWRRMWQKVRDLETMYSEQEKSVARIDRTLITEQLNIDIAHEDIGEIQLRLENLSKIVMECRDASDKKKVIKEPVAKPIERPAAKSNITKKKPVAKPAPKSTVKEKTEKKKSDA